MEQEIHQGEEYTTSCFSCGFYGHKAAHAQCKSNPEGKDFSGAGGSVKKAGAGNGSGVEGPPKLTKAPKRTQNKLKKAE